MSSVGGHHSIQLSRADFVAEADMHAEPALGDWALTATEVELEQVRDIVDSRLWSYRTYSQATVQAVILYVEGSERTVTSRRPRTELIRASIKHVP